MFSFQRNIQGGLKVLKEMKNADVKPDSETFSYLIFNCTCEEDIIKVHLHYFFISVEKSNYCVRYS